MPFIFNFFLYLCRIVFVSNWKAMIYVLLVVSFVLIIVGAMMLTDGSVAVAQKFKVPEFIVGLTIVAVGTSMPELTVSFMSALAGKGDMAIGNVVGSNIFNITLILGLSSQVMPLTSSGITIIDYLVMIGASILPLFFGFRGQIGRLGGAVMVICFVAYNWYLITDQIA